MIMTEIKGNLDVDSRVFGIAFNLILVLSFVMVCLSLTNNLFIYSDLTSLKLIVDSFVFYGFLIGFLKYSPKIFGGVFIYEKI